MEAWPPRVPVKSKSTLSPVTLDYCKNIYSRVLIFTLYVLLRRYFYWVGVPWKPKRWSFVWLEMVNSKSNNKREKDVNNLRLRRRCHEERTLNCDCRYFTFGNESKLRSSVCQTVRHGLERIQWFNNCLRKAEEMSLHITATKCSSNLSHKVPTCRWTSKLY